MIRKTVSALLDVAAIALAYTVSAAAFKSHIAGIIGASAVAAYGVWCFWDGITTHQRD